MFPRLAAPVFKIHKCQICSKQENSYQQFSMHQFKAHGIKDDIRLYVGGGFTPATCRVCLKHFHTRERILNHVKKSKVCRINAFFRGPVYTQKEAEELDASLQEENRNLQRAGFRRHVAKEPTFQVVGPFYNVVIEPDLYSDHHPLGRGHNYY